MSWIYITDTEMKYRDYVFGPSNDTINEFDDDDPLDTWLPDICIRIILTSPQPPGAESPQNFAPGALRRGKCHKNTVQ